LRTFTRKQKHREYHFVDNHCAFYKGEFVADFISALKSHDSTVFQFFASMQYELKSTVAFSVQVNCLQKFHNLA